jgi:putative endonuclease
LKVKELNKIKGNYGENLAIEFLKENEYEILERNYKNKFGEIDIVARKREMIIFIEVKYRENLNYGEGVEAVDFYKRNHIRNVAKVFIMKNHLENLEIRFDVIEILKINTKYQITQIKSMEV